MPLLFLLAIPLCNWQLHIGLFLLKTFQMLVDFFATISTKAPSLEVNLFTIFIIVCFLYSKSRALIFALFIYCNSLNLDFDRPYSHPTKEFVPSGRILKTSYGESEVLLILGDGKCRKKLVRGFWWESCSPRRGSKKRTS